MVPPPSPDRRRGIQRSAATRGRRSPGLRRVCARCALSVPATGKKIDRGGLPPLAPDLEVLARPKCGRISRRRSVLFWWRFAWRLSSKSFPASGKSNKPPWTSTAPDLAAPRRPQLGASQRCVVRATQQPVEAMMKKKCPDRWDSDQSLGNPTNHNCSDETVRPSASATFVSEATAPPPRRSMRVGRGDCEGERKPGRRSRPDQRPFAPFDPARM